MIIFINQLIFTLLTKETTSQSKYAYSLFVCALYITYKLFPQIYSQSSQTPLTDCFILKGSSKGNLFK